MRTRTPDTTPPAESKKKRTRKGRRKERPILQRSPHGVYRCYEAKDFSHTSYEIIVQANSIIAEYEAAGFSLTLRQLYYQFVARDILPNTQQSYKRLGSIINDARLAGHISWTAIEDRTRNMQALPHWSSPKGIMSAVVEQYRIDKWREQPYRPEVWIEKEALSGVIAGICTELQVPYFACRGYNSQSEQWSAGRRFRSYYRDGQLPIVFHLGDHDPSGIDMTRDNEFRLTLFAEDDVEVRRLALNWDQIEEYDPPPNPAKMTDSRFEGYESRFGDECWELDALEPQVIADLVETSILSIRDPDLWEAACEEEEEHRKELQTAMDGMS